VRDLLESFLELKGVAPWKLTVVVLLPEIVVRSDFIVDQSHPLGVVPRALKEAFGILGNSDLLKVTGLLIDNLFIFTLAWA
jgi:hypothetical protein